MNSEEHWEHVYNAKAADQVSWFQPHLKTSLALVERATSGDLSVSIADIGGGASTLVDDLLARGYVNLAVLDISQKALDVTRARLGRAGSSVQWIHADAMKPILPPRSLDVWHDRAVFHFLTKIEDRRAYVRAVLRTVRPGGHVIVSTFGPEGPPKCSGLETMRYDADALHKEFGASFQLLESSNEVHHTPFGTTQQFLYCHCSVS
jgi:SAM-dependent methyltransferase